MISGVFVRRAHRKLVAVRLPEHDRARRFHARNSGAVIWRYVLLQSLRSGRSANAARAHHVLNSHGHTAQRWQRFALRRHAVDAVALLESSLFRKGEERADLAVFLLNAGVVRL